MSSVIATKSRVKAENFYKLAPEVLSALAAIGKSAAQAGLEPEMLELVKLRASQLNGCAYCLQYHLNEAGKLKIDANKINLVATWRDAGIFTEREMAALEWAEHLTLLANAHVTDGSFDAVRTHFSERELIFLSASIGQINFWNRIAAPFSFEPPIPASAQ